VIKISNFYTYHSFLEFYKARIYDVLCEIDILIKTSENYINITEISKVLNLNEEEINNIMISKGLKNINQKSFFTVMEQGSSYICKLYQKEKETGSPYFYTPEQIAYIYDLDTDIVVAICEELGIAEITSFLLADIFGEITIDFFDH